MEDIEAVVSPSLEFSVFEMLDFLFAGDLARAERSLQTLLMGGQTCVGVFSMVVRQLRMLAHLALAQRGGRTPRQWKRRSNCIPTPPGAPPHRPVRWTRRRSWRSTARAWTADAEIKSGRLRDREALQLFMLKIVEMRGKAGTSRGR